MNNLSSAKQALKTKVINEAKQRGIRCAGCQREQKAFLYTCQVDESGTYDLGTDHHRFIAQDNKNNFVYHCPDCLYDLTHEVKSLQNP